MQIKKLLDSIERDVDTVSPDETVYDALALMAEKEIGALVVVEKGKMVGIFSERDYARKVILKGILDPEDAKMAVKLGADAIIVRNVKEGSWGLQGGGNTGFNRGNAEAIAVDGENKAEAQIAGFALGDLGSTLVDSVDQLGDLSQLTLQI